LLKRIKRLRNFNKRAWVLRALCAGFVVGLFCLFASPAYAVDNPDSITIGDSYVFRDVLEDGDWLVFVRYDVNYGSVPDDYASECFYMALLDGDGDVLGGTHFQRELEYYQHNIRSIYLTASQVTEASLTWESEYKLRVSGFASKFDPLVEGTNMKTTTLTSSNYYEGSELGGVMLSQAQILEDDWGITLLTNGLLNVTGQAYFVEAVPDLASMDSSIFSTAIAQMEVDDTYLDMDTEYSDALVDNKGPILGGAIEDLAGTFRVSETWASIWLVAMLSLTFSGIVFAATKDTGMAMMVGVPIAVGAAYMGIGGTDMFATVASIAIVAAVLFGIHFILGRFAA